MLAVVQKVIDRIFVLNNLIFSRIMTQTQLLPGITSLIILR